jgi:hypothetical protein
MSASRYRHTFFPLVCCRRSRSSGSADAASPTQVAPAISLSDPSTAKTSLTSCPGLNIGPHPDLHLSTDQTLKGSWALWEALTEGDGEDPETLLLDEIPVGTLEGAWHALFGSWRGDPRSVHLEAV